jgi:hypothetical protein
VANAALRLPTPDNPKICATPFEFARGAFTLRGKPLDFSGRPWLPDVYNLEVTDFPGGRRWGKSILQFGRQSEKSTSVGYKLLSMAAMEPFLRCLYVNPSGIQIREFSDERLKLPMEESDFMHQFLKDRWGRTIPQNVNTKWLGNNAKISLRSCFLTADRIRGLAMDLLMVDEFQDILTDNLPVIEETLFHCERDDGPVSVYAGTPKGFDTPLEFYYTRLSTQAEWLTKCNACNKWNSIRLENIGKTGLICSKCRGGFDPVNDRAEWVCMGPISAPYFGFRLPQPAVIYSYKKTAPHLFDTKWEDLRLKLKKYKPQRLMNEVFALPFDGGSKPITRDQLRACCNPDFQGKYEKKIFKTLRLTPRKWVGLDWGSGTTASTVLTVLRYKGNRLQLAYWKEFSGFEAEPEFVIQEIVRICKAIGVSRIGADYGFGFGMNSQLRRVFQGKLAEYQYVGTQKIPVNWGETKFTAHRTTVMSWLFELIRRELIEFPAWDIFQEEMLDHFLCISQDDNARMKQIVYNHPPGTKDDFFHSILYAVLISMWDVPRPDLTAPDSVGKTWSVLRPV